MFFGVVAFLGLICLIIWRIIQKPEEYNDRSIDHDDSEVLRPILINGPPPDPYPVPDDIPDPVSEQTKIVCPFCYSEFMPDKVRFRFKFDDVVRYISADVDSSRETLEFLASRNLYAEFVWNEKGIPVQCRIRDKDTNDVTAVSHTRVCKNPKCNQILSANAGTYPSDNAVFVIGLKSSGKTVYITSVIEILKKILPMKLRCSIMPYNNEVSKEYAANYYNVMYENHELPPATLQAAQLTYEVMSPNALNIKKTIGITFSDMKGEMATDPDPPPELAMVLDHSSYFILTIDLADPNITDVENIINNVLSFATGDDKRKKDRYLAVVITKSDMLMGKINDPVFTIEGSTYDGKQVSIYNNLQWDNDSTETEKDRAAVNHLLREYLINDPKFANFIMRAEMEFLPQNVNYFAVSALGHEPDPDGRIENISPIRVEEPIIWLLKNSGII